MALRPLSRISTESVVLVTSISAGHILDAGVDKILSNPIILL
jgi:hypothetical protein